jgi:heat-inducible transcriptional repressor
MRLAAAVLAHTSQVAAFVTAPRPRFNRLKHVQLISTRGRLVLMVMVLYGGEVRQQMLDLAEPVSQSRLSDSATRLNMLFDGCNFDQIDARFSKLDDELDRDITRLLMDMLRHSDAATIRQIYRDGLSNILDDEGTRQAVRVIEERSLLADVFGDVLEPHQSGVQVVIGGEGRWEELKYCTLILARYGMGTELSGELAVLGSIRMPYERNISAVRYVADIMTGFLNEYIAETPGMDEVT